MLQLLSLFLSLVTGFFHEEEGDIIQNLGWLVAVSVGAAVVGGLVYTGIKTYGTTVKSKVETMTVTPPAAPTY